jgi:hypothetical protein
MIRVKGTAELRVWYEVELDMTEDEFDALPAKQQDELLESAIDWQEVNRSAEVQGFEIDDLVEEDEEESA